jgi:lysophospholipase L1-like esterase
VIFSSITPINNYTQYKELYDQRPRDRILQLNQWMQNYCAAHGLIYLNYFPALVDDQGMLKRDLSDDGLHPNKPGYAIMAPLAEKAIEKALNTPAAK